MKITVLSVIFWHSISVKFEVLLAKFKQRITPFAKSYAGSFCFLELCRFPNKPYSQYVGMTAWFFDAVFQMQCSPHNWKLISRHFI